MAEQGGSPNLVDAQHPLPDEKKHKKRKHDKDGKDKKEKKSSKGTGESRKRKWSPSNQPGTSSAPEARSSSPPPWSAPANLQVWSVPKADAVQMDPTLCLVYGVGSATPEGVAREITRLGGTAAFVSTMDRLAIEHLDSGEPWVSGACWGLLFITQQSTDASFADFWTPFKETGGNMMTVLAKDVGKVAQFFAAHPRAIECTGLWSQTASAHTLLIISFIAKGLSL